MSEAVIRVARIWIRTSPGPGSGIRPDHRAGSDRLWHVYTTPLMQACWVMHRSCHRIRPIPPAIARVSPLPSAIASLHPFARKDDIVTGSDRHIGAVADVARVMLGQYLAHPVARHLAGVARTIVLLVWMAPASTGVAMRDTAGVDICL